MSAGAVVAAIAIMIGLLGVPTVRDQLRASLTHEPTRYTELYFLDPNQLPVHADADHAVRFSFAIANHSPSSTEYRVQLEANTGDSDVALGGVQTVAVDANKQVTQLVQVTLPRSNRVSVGVALLGRSESIRFWVSA